MSEMSKTWTIDAEGVLTIRQGFRKRKGLPEFYDKREEIRAIVVEEGVREIGDGWFNYLNEVREISLPTTLSAPVSQHHDGVVATNGSDDLHVGAFLRDMCPRLSYATDSVQKP